MTEAKMAAAETDLDKRMQSVLGLRMEKASADTFKVMVAINALLFLGLAGIAAFLVIRKPSGNGRPSRSKSSE
jgi:hypothetical protein